MPPMASYSRNWDCRSAALMKSLHPRVDVASIEGFVTRPTKPATMEVSYRWEILEKPGIVRGPGAYQPLRRIAITIDL